MGLLNLEAAISTAVTTAVGGVVGAVTGTTPAPTGTTTTTPILGATVSLGGDSSPEETVPIERLHLYFDEMDDRAHAIRTIRDAATEWFGTSDYVMTELTARRGDGGGSAAGRWNVIACFVLSRS